MDFITLTNKVLLAMNETEINVANGLSSARGIQKTAMQNVNSAYMDMVNHVIEWPFNYAEGTITTVAGTHAYAKEDGTKSIDWNSFIATKLDEEDNIVPTRLFYTDLNTARDTFAAELKREGDLYTGSPSYVFADKAGNINFYPSPDEEYTITYDYWNQPEALVADTDIPLIPTHYHSDLVEGALVYTFRTRSDYEAAGRYNQTFTKALKRMRMELIGIPEKITSSRRIPTAGSNARRI